MAFVPESLFQSSNDDDDRHHSFISSSSCIPQSFQGMEFLMMRRSSPASLISGINQQADYHQSHHEHDDDDASDDGSQFMIGEKKRRLNVEQVKALEKSFELGNKLEPERKLQLARALGLQPRQISIWFQNRRARSKTKQLERDYGVLKRQIESIKADNDALKSQNKKLLAQLMDLKDRESTMISTFNLNNKENNQQGYWRNNGIDNSNLNTNGHLIIFSSSQSQDVNDLTRQEERVHQMSHQKTDHHATDGLCSNVYAGVEEISSEYWTTW